MLWAMDTYDRNRWSSRTAGRPRGYNEWASQRKGVSRYSAPSSSPLRRGSGRSRSWRRFQTHAACCHRDDWSRAWRGGSFAHRNSGLVASHRKKICAVVSKRHVTKAIELLKVVRFTPTSPAKPTHRVRHRKIHSSRASPNEQAHGQSEILPDQTPPHWWTQPWWQSHLALGHRRLSPPSLSESPL